ncbi:hypothetical protein DYI24_06010 [Rhodopseudomonas sp. BR0C11]|uniref:hypothetical protein n=1 Tax=Rhodopseudomonas sp. BR0C11 TaxID=2269370 RepID=UPI0013E02EE3|nr:hypothetical protein [Rhodopseudomonas sp. BR0C11]NEV76594.1 hypothetical protein [Rhodopseudomonas sp. BR0C11]
MTYMSSDDYVIGKRMCEDMTAEAFESDFPKVTGRSVKVVGREDPPDVIAVIDGVETGVELTAIMAASAQDIVLGMHRLAKQKHEKYDRRALFSVRPMILLGHLTWPAISTKERDNLTMDAMRQAIATFPALWDVWEEVDGMYDPSDFDGIGFSEIWLMDDGMKYTSRRDPRAPADFFCFAPSEQGGFWQLERKRRHPYWHLYAGD